MTWHRRSVAPRDRPGADASVTGPESDPRHRHRAGRPAGHDPGGGGQSAANHHRARLRRGAGGGGHRHGSRSHRPAGGRSAAGVRGRLTDRPRPDASYGCRARRARLDARAHRGDRGPVAPGEPRESVDRHRRDGCRDRGRQRRGPRAGEAGLSDRRSAGDGSVLHGARGNGRRRVRVGAPDRRDRRLAAGDRHLGSVQRGRRPRLAAADARLSDGGSAVREPEETPSSPRWEAVRDVRCGGRRWPGRCR